ncbi:hypothetical protein V2J09_022583 [Rumex salicifolius]
MWHSTGSFDIETDVNNNNVAKDYSSNFTPEKRETVPQGVDPKRGWNFRGVHKAVLCGTVRQTPVQKLLRNGKTLTVFNVGTGGMFDQRTLSTDLPKPAQWHRIVVHNEQIGAYAVQQLTKNSSVYVEGDIELRVYNKGITGEVVKLPEICVRTNGIVRLIRTGEAINNISFQELQLEQEPSMGGEEGRENEGLNGHELD